MAGTEKIVSGTEKTSESARTAEAGPGTQRRDDGTDRVFEVDEVLTPEERTLRADRIIQDHVALATASGLIPGPALDLAAAFTVQMTMLKRLSSLYGVPFRHDLAKSLVMSLVASLGGVGAGAIAAVSMIKVVPGLGTLVGVLGTSLSLSAFTYAVGKVFQHHFASGGSFLDLHPRAYRDYFRDMFRRGKERFGGRGAAVTSGVADAADPTLKRATVRA